MFPTPKRPITWPARLRIASGHRGPSTCSAAPWTKGISTWRCSNAIPGWIRSVARSGSPPRWTGPGCGRARLVRRLTAPAGAGCSPWPGRPADRQLSDPGPKPLRQRAIDGCDDMTASAEMVNAIEIVRKQIEDDLKANAGKGPAEQALQAIDQKLLAVELQLVSRTDMYSDDKWYVEPYKIYQNLIWLNGVVNSGAGDVAGGADERPTDASVGVLDGLSKELNLAKAAYQQAMDRDVPAFNQSAARLGLKPLTAVR